MGIGDIFRPKHRHSDVVVRVEAVRALGPDEREIALEVARADSEPAVRKLALDKIEDPELLIELSSSESDEEVRAHARARAVSLWISRASSSRDVGELQQLAQRMSRIGEDRAIVELAVRVADEAAQRAVADCIDDPRALGELVRQTDNSELQTYVLDRLDDVEVLRSIAIDELRKSIALAALGRIADREVIEAIAARGKSKAVRSRAKKILSGIVPDDLSAPSVEKQRHAERVQLCSLVEKLAAGHEWVESYEQVSAAEARWSALGAGDDDELAARFARACERYFELYDRSGRFGKKPPVSEPRAEATRAAVAPPAEPEPERPPSEAGAPDPEDSRAEPQPEPEHDPAKPGRDGAKRAQDEERARNLALLEQLCQRLESMATADKLKNAERKLAQVEAKHKEVGPLPSGQRRPASERYEEARRRAIIRLAELREAEEWKRWANVPKQEELIGRVKALAEAEPTEQLAEELHKLQLEWRDVGPAPPDKSQELWTQFKTACDVVYERVKGFRAQLSDQKKDNLQKKEELCAAAEELSESTDWEQTAQDLKRLQAEWKNIGPVPRRQSDAVWKRFRAACDKFFERRKPFLEEAMSERNRNVEQKQAVVEAAEALLSSTDWEAAIERVGDLRQDWRRTGPVPQRAFAELSRRFQDACDAVYRKRDEARDAEKNAHRAEIDALRSETEALLGDREADPSVVASKTLELRGAAKRLGGDRSEPARELRAAIEALCRQAIETHPTAFRGSELDPETSRRRKEKLCARIEELIPADKPPERAPTTAEEMAARLRAALADRALGGVLSKQHERSVEDIIREARESWARLGPIPGPDGLALEQRFEQACQRARG